MKLRILATAMLSPLWLTASVRADSPHLKQIQAIQPCLSCNAKTKQPILIAKSDWKKFSPDNGRFAVLLPGKPTEETETEKTDDGTTVHHTFSLATETGAFVVMYSDFPMDITIIKPDALLDEACKGLSTGGDQLLSQRRISLGAYPGREIEYKTQNGTTGKARIFLVGQRLYQLHVAFPQAADTKKFFDSFELMQKQS